MTIRCDFTACAKSTHASVAEAREAHANLQVVVETTVTTLSRERVFTVSCLKKSCPNTFSATKEFATSVKGLCEDHREVQPAPAAQEVLAFIEAQPKVCEISHRSAEAQARCKKGIHAS